MCVPQSGVCTDMNNRLEVSTNIMEKQVRLTDSHCKWCSPGGGVGGGGRSGQPVWTLRCVLSSSADASVSACHLYCVSESAFVENDELRQRETEVSESRLPSAGRRIKLQVTDCTGRRTGPITLLLFSACTDVYAVAWVKKIHGGEMRLCKVFATSIRNKEFWVLSEKEDRRQTSAAGRNTRSKSKSCGDGKTFILVINCICAARFYKTHLPQWTLRV